MKTQNSTSLIGSRVPRSDARAKVCGTEKFIADYALPDMLHVAVIRSPVACGELRGSNRRHLETLPGVVATIFAEDIPGENCVPIVWRDMPCLATGKTKYAGEPVGLIGAQTAEAARRALAEARLDIHPLPALTDPESARNADAPRVHGEDNVFSHLVIRRGNTEKGLTEAAAVVEGFYRTPYQEHAYLEPQGMLAIPEGDGSITVMGSMQCPFYVQSAVATVLGLP